MDFASLEIFRAVAAESSVTRAAERLKRVQSNVTTRIQQLEDDLGAKLFLREGKRMTLTSEGEIFLTFANRLLALEDEGRQAVAPGRPVGSLRVGSMESTAASRLPNLLAQFHLNWPDVGLSLSMGPTEVLLDRVKSYELDCAFIAQPPPLFHDVINPDLDPSLEGRKIFVEEILLIVPRGKGRRSNKSEPKIRSIATLQLGCTYRRMAEAWLTKDHSVFEAPLNVIELGSYHAILACVATGTCIGVIPKSVLDLQKPTFNLQTISLGKSDTLLVHRKGYQSSALEAFRDVVFAR
jgi:DNA-binding transcriptional LysR family regulator